MNNYNLYSYEENGETRFDIAPVGQRPRKDNVQLIAQGENLTPLIVMRDRMNKKYAEEQTRKIEIKHQNRKDENDCACN